MSGSNGAFLVRRGPSLRHGTSTAHRIVTHPRVAAHPLTGADAWGFVDRWLPADPAWIPPATERTAAILERLMTKTTGNLVPDVQLAPSRPARDQRIVGGSIGT